MKSITIRKVPEPVHRQLRVRAAKNGRSLESELRAVLIKLARLEYDSAKGQLRETDADAEHQHEDGHQGKPIKLTESDISVKPDDAMRKVRSILSEEMAGDANAA